MVIGTGGYTTAAVLIAQRLIRGRIVIHEQNTVPGRTNLWLAHISDRVCLSFEGSTRYFARGNTVLTGLPIRKDFAALPGKTEARRTLGLAEDAFTILVVGGSQGAKRINELMLDAWPTIDDGATQVVHQVGGRNIEEVRSRFLQRFGEADAQVGGRYRIEAYVEMPVAMAAADLLIGRSGASTVAEIAAAGLPSILIPYPFAVANEQKLNAEYLSERGAAVVREESECSPEELSRMVLDLRSSPEKLGAMASASAALAKPDAARKVAEVALCLARPRPTQFTIHNS